MKASLILAAFAVLALLEGCGSDAPLAPIGLDRHPANSPQVLAALRRVGETPSRLVTREPTAVAELLRTQSDTGRAAEPTRLVRAEVVVLSDASVRGGIANLPSSDRARLVEAARSALSISLFCRGDHLKPSRANRIALILRGVEVKRFLVGQGVDPGRIHLFVRSSGAFVADNSTPAGRAQNRRVEIHFG